MYPLLESIKICDGEYQLLDYHTRRMSRSLMELYGTAAHPVEFEKITEELNTNSSPGIFKLRIEYGKEEYKYTVTPYSIKPVQSLLVVDSDTLDYSLKYSDRSPLEQLYSKRETHDDIIICRHGAITDSYYANLAFEKDGVWFTPDTPLLQGVKRTWLIQSGAIKEKEIYIEDLPDYSRICLFNAMIEFGELELPVGAIHIP